jgi:hypothetical protein
MIRRIGHLLGTAFALGTLMAACSSDRDGDNASGDAGDGAAGAAQSGGAGGGSPGRGGTGAVTTGGSAGAQTGGSSGTGGQSGGGGNGGNGGAMDGGSVDSGSGGASAGGSGGTGGASTGCKRGIAANTAPGAEFFPAITWWYNWAMQPSGADVGIEFVPMVWGSGSLSASVPTGSSYLLTFNEPNFHAQSNLTAQEAASYWPMIEAKADAAGIPIVGPGMNFCGPAQNCNGTNPYQYLRDFFAACSGCQVDYVAVHWYNCDLPSLRDYLEPGGNLEGFEQFGKPIWLTEFSCDGGASVAEQEAYMREAIPYLEANPNVFRYSWFSAGPIPNAILINGDGSPTALGDVYIGLEQSCP